MVDVQPTFCEGGAPAVTAEQGAEARARMQAAGVVYATSGDSFAGRR